MTKRDIKNKDIELEPMEISSNRTAENPGPELPEDNGCCAPKPPAKEGEEEQKASYIPTIVSLVLLLAGIGLDFFEVDWFSGYLRLVVFGIAFILVGGNVIKHAVTNIAKGEVFNEFFLMSIATIGAFFLENMQKEWLLCCFTL